MKMPCARTRYSARLNNFSLSVAKEFFLISRTKNPSPPCGIRCCHHFVPPTHYIYYIAMASYWTLRVSAKVACDSPSR